MNLRLLDQEIKFIAFNEIRKPSAAINAKLHDRRQDLSFLSSQVGLAMNWIPKSISDQLIAIREISQEERIYVGIPHEMLSDILKRSEFLERFLIDSFNLLISSTTVLEAEIAAEQGIRAQRLTTLAFLYIPISFVTSIFGMNVKEINESTLPIWIVLVVAVITLGFTAALFTVYAWWERNHLRRKQRN
jgi:Mg2+ and Co2+ transporter CorA